MTEARKSYMTKEQLEQYLSDLRNNKPQRPTGSRPVSLSTQKTRWSLLRSSTSASAPPTAEPKVVDSSAPPSLHSDTPPPRLSRRESKLIRKHSSPTHKRTSTTSSLLGFVRSPSRSGTVRDQENGDENEQGWDGVDRQDGRTSDAGGPARSLFSARKERESAPAGSLRGFSYARSSLKSRNRPESISSGSSTSSSSGNSEDKKRVSWKLPALSAGTSGGEPFTVMPPCHPLKPADAPQIEKELTLHFRGLTTQEHAEALPTIAPLRINKSSPSSSPPRTQSKAEPFKSVLDSAPRVPSQAPSGPRREYGSSQSTPHRPSYVEPWKREPTQVNHPQYTTTTKSLPSPPNSGSDEDEAEEAEILKELGRRPLPKAGGPSGQRGQTPPEDAPVRRNNTKYGAQIRPPPPPVIGLVTTPSVPQMSTPSISVAKASGPTMPIPSISFPDDEPRVARSKGPSIPTFNLPDEPRETRSIPTINLPDDPRDSRPIPTFNLPDEPRSTSSRPLPSPHAPASAYSSASSASRTRGPTVTCNLCRNFIPGRAVSAGALRFHPECFRCDHCHASLEHVGFYPEPPENRRTRLAKAGIRDGDNTANGAGHRFYCHLDYHELFSPRCKSCKTPIEGEVVVACGSTWHQGHFFCAECGDSFNSESKFVEKDGHAWCVGCYTKRFSSKCKKCRKPVTETVIKALGGEWHEECFCCTECNSTFNDGRFFIRGTEGREVPVCVSCEERRLKV
ncbi:hypothetical protein BZA77DRAFT_333088 [Pyronema omphalodes]|nr:hypothetical protein BZA77DRAFT_333088 [Pyronema omphalodes]